jgi:hypothetical protein
MLKTIWNEISNEGFDWVHNPYLKVGFEGFVGSYETLGADIPRLVGKASPMTRSGGATRSVRASTARTSMVSTERAMLDLNKETFALDHKLYEAYGQESADLRAGKYAAALQEAADFNAEQAALEAPRRHVVADGAALARRLSSSHVSVTATKAQAAKAIAFVVDRFKAQHLTRAQITLLAGSAALTPRPVNLLTALAAGEV